MLEQQEHYWLGHLPSSLLCVYIVCLFTNALPEGMSVYPVYAWCPWRSPEGIGSRGTGVTGSY